MRIRCIAVGLALALVLVACAGSATTTTTSVPSATSAPTTQPPITAPPTTVIVPDEAAFADLITVGAPLQLSSTHKVANVPDDDILNARRVPGAGGPLVAEIDPAYGQVRFTGESEVVDDGGVWAKVVLADPNVQLVHDPESFELPWGWVNSFYIEPITDFGPIGGTCDPGVGAASHPGDPASDYDHLVDLLLTDFAGCTQLTITLAQGDGLNHLGVTLPKVTTTAMPGLLRLEIPNPSSGWIDVIWPASELIGDGVSVYVVRAPGGEGVWIDVYAGGDAGVRYLAGQGQIVVDLAAEPTEGPERNGTVVVTGSEMASGQLMIAGYARPFEANLSVVVRDAGGQVVDVPATGESVYKPGAGAFSVVTTDWLETWGWYEFALDTTVLPAGEYVVRLADDTATEDAPFLEIPFTTP